MTDLTGITDPTTFINALLIDAFHDAEKDEAAALAALCFADRASFAAAAATYDAAHARVVAAGKAIDVEVDKPFHSPPDAN